MSLHSLHKLTLDNEDIYAKLDAIYSILLPEILECRKRGLISVRMLEEDYDEVCGVAKWTNSVAQGPLSFQKLMDLKCIFEMKSLDGYVGISEKQFIALFAKTLCPATDPDDIHRWFMHIDLDSNGFCDWEEFSTYLIQSKHVGNNNNEFIAPPSYSTFPSTPNFSVKHPLFISKAVINTQLGLYYCASMDGTVRVWNAKTMELINTIHYPEGSAIVDLKFCSVKSRLYVLQDDGLLFVYECGCGAGVKKGVHKLIRTMRVQGVDPALEDMIRKGQVPQVTKTVDFDPTKMVVVFHTKQTEQKMNKSEQRTVKYPIDVTLIQSSVGAKEKMCSCKSKMVGTPVVVEPGRDLFYNPITLDNRSYVFLGATDGHVTLIEKSSQKVVLNPIAMWEPHTAEITKMIATTKNPQLQGLFTSSMDHTVQFLDVEKNRSAFRLNVDVEYSGGGKGVRCMDYGPTRNVLATAGFGREVIIWDPMSQRFLTLLSDHKHPIVDVCFNEDLNQIISLDECKVIKVWDMRTFMCVQTMIDKERRYPEDKFTSLLFDSQRSSILTTSHVPHIFRDTVVQAKFESGMTWTDEYNGHVHPVVGAIYNKTSNHVVTTDGESVLVWNSETGDRVGKWFTRCRVNALIFDCYERRMLTASDNGLVQTWYYAHGKLLKEFIGNSTITMNFELNAIVHFELVEGSSTTAMVVAAGSSHLVPLWLDRFSTSHEEVSVAQPCFIINIVCHSTDHKHLGMVSSLTFIKPNKVAIGTSVGDVLVYAISSATFPQFLCCMATDMFASLRGMTSSNRPRSHTIRDSLPTTSKWRRVLEAADKHYAVPGAKEFTHFRVDVQRSLLVVTEHMVFITDDLLLTFHGDGDCVVWKVTSGSLDMISAFPATHSPGSTITSVFYNKPVHELTCGDSFGVLSVFNLHRPVAMSRMKRLSRSGQILPLNPESLDAGDAKSFSTKKNPSSDRLYFNDVHVEYVKHHALPFGAITALQYIQPTPHYSFFLIGSADCSVALIDASTYAIVGIFGLDTDSLNKWVTFDIDTYKLGTKGPSTPSGDVHPSSQGPHRFLSIFSNSLSASTNLNTANNHPHLSNRPVSSLDGDRRSSSKVFVTTATPNPSRANTAMGGPRKLSLGNATDEELPELLELYNNRAPPATAEEKLKKFKERMSVHKQRTPDLSYRVLKTKELTKIPKDWTKPLRSTFETDRYL